MIQNLTTPRRTRSKRYPNPRRVKIHRSYTVEEIARLLGKHKNTVREWLKAGLPSCDKKRPRLILGHHLASFLQTHRAKRKQPCRPGEIYCVRCRAPKLPAGDMADYVAITGTIGNLVAICPDCSSIVNRRVNLAKLGEVRGKIDITFPQALQRVYENNQPSVSSDLKEGVCR